MLKIGWQYYTVEMIDKFIYNDHGEKLYGIQNGADSKIKISTKFDKSRQELTFIHEVIHALDENLEIGLSEKKTNALAGAIYGFMQDNRTDVQNYILNEKAYLEEVLTR